MKPISDAIAIGAAWLDAELFMRAGDESCKHSVRLMDYVDSKLIGNQKWGPQVIKCRYCGYLPVRHETTIDSGQKLFCYICPHEDCHSHWRWPTREAWKSSRQEAANYWNRTNAK